MSEETIYTSTPAAAEIAIGADNLIELDAGELRRREIEAMAQGMRAEWIPQVVEALADRDWRVRRAAATALACDEETEVAEVLCSLLESEDPGERNAAVKALIKRGPDSVPALLRTLGAEDPDARNFACVALGQIGDESAVGGLTTVSLEDTDPNVRYVAIEALGRVGEPRAVDALISHLDADPYLASVAAEALGSVGGPRALEALAHRLADDPVGVAAADALGNIGDPRVLLPLSHAAAEHGILVGVPALRSIGRTVAAASSADAAVIALLRTPAREMANQNTVDSLVYALREGGEEADSALHAAAWLGMPELAESVCMAADAPERAPLAVDFLTQSMDDVRGQLQAAASSDHPSVRMVAAMAIERAGDRSDLPTTIKLVHDDNQAVCIAATKALARVGDSASAKELIAPLESGVDEIAFAAADAMGRLGPQTAVPRMVELAEEGGAVVRRAVARAFSAAALETDDPSVTRCLLTLARDPDARIRAEIAPALGAAATTEAISALLVLSLDEDRDVRLSAIRTLSRRSEPAAHRALRGATADESCSIRAAAARGLFRNIAEQDVELALTLLHDSDPGTVIASVSGLATSGLPEATQAVVRLCDHESADVRAAVLRALHTAELDTARELAAVILSRGEPAWNVRLAAAETLAGCDETAGARPIIEQTLIDEEPMVRAAAVAAVPTALGDEAASLLIELLHDSTLQEPAGRALESMGPSASADLAAALEDLEGPARRLATFALGTMHTDESCTALEAMLGSGDLEDVWNATMAVVTCGCVPHLPRFKNAEGSTTETVLTVLDAATRRGDCGRE